MQCGKHGRVQVRLAAVVGCGATAAGVHRPAPALVRVDHHQVVAVLARCKALRAGLGQSAAHAIRRVLLLVGRHERRLAAQIGGYGERMPGAAKQRAQDSEAARADIARQHGEAAPQRRQLLALP